MKTDNPKGKLYLIPTTLGESDPMDVLPQTVKRAIDFIDHYIVENEKTARRFIKAVNAQKVQAENFFTQQTHRSFRTYCDD
jgi:16S rRNA (cytidine1402-2'-O)-methyltransferase